MHSKGNNIHVLIKYCVYISIYLNYSRECGIWDYNSIGFYLGRLRFINRRIPSIFLYGLFNFPTWQAKNNLHPIEFNQFLLEESPFSSIKKTKFNYKCFFLNCHIVLGQMSPISRLRHNLLLNDLPKEVLSSCKNSNQLMRFLDRLDASHYQRIRKECANLEHVVSSTNSILLQSDGYENNLKF